MPRDDEELRELQVEMIDRFGLLPEPAKNLFAVTEMKLVAERLGIRKIEAGDGGGRILFKPQPNIDPMKVIELIQTQPQIYKLDGADKLRFSQSFATPASKIGFVWKLLDTLRRRWPLPASPG
ncbi:MAG: hypothetical protein MZW92_16755 [Comamonadaceae bacterium]|nr:hypothetical protein [Comamonadaceae bacterium]